jgi:uncharacterized protein HemX
MRLISQVTPTPRLLSTVVPDVREKPAERVSVRSRLKGVSFFTGNGRAIFLGLVVGAALICAVGFLYKRQQIARQHTEAERTMVAVSTKSISHPEPIVIQISADLIHVTAISLGHPRLATINGRTIAEGDYVTVHPPTANVAVTLRVLKISDGRIELSNGPQLITARLEIPSGLHPRP